MTQRQQKQISPTQFFRQLRWIDKRALQIEDYRQKIFQEALFTFEPDGRPTYNLVLTGRAKKNWKSADLILAALYRLVAWKSEGGNQCYCLANDEAQAGDNLALSKKLIRVNPILSDAVKIKQKVIERKDGEGFLEILPAQDVAGTHGKTYLFAGFDEIHEYRTWNLLEAMALDPSRPDAMQWITSYASIYHKPGVPLFDMFAQGKRGEDPRMLFSWYAADYTTDPDYENALPEDRANPSKDSWGDDHYLQQQQRRLPMHKFRRLHLNLPGLPEGSAFTAEKIMEVIERGIKIRQPKDGVEYVGFVDMSGGSSDDACLAIAHREGEGDEARAVLDLVMNQGATVPFDPRLACERFSKILKSYRCFSVTGDKYGGETFIQDFERHDIGYHVSELTKSQLYEVMEPKLNSGTVVLLDEPKMESQLLGLVWRGGKIDHPGGEHDDFSNACAGAVHCAFEGAGSMDIEAYGSYVQPDWGTDAPSNEGETLADQLDRMQDRGTGRGSLPDW
ncbi:MAG: hypothetical protein HYY46_23175 [Deltaproteobacteria bacterium]|nr:hypothetical protein [Deltaproteobacteria bacterium]